MWRLQGADVKRRTIPRGQKGADTATFVVEIRRRDHRELAAVVCWAQAQGSLGTTRRVQAFARLRDRLHLQPRCAERDERGCAACGERCWVCECTGGWQDPDYREDQEL